MLNEESVEERQTNELEALKVNLSMDPLIKLLI